MAKELYIYFTDSTVCTNNNGSGLRVRGAASLFIYTGARSRQ